MQNRPLVSILINNYNYGQYLKDAIESALSQTYSPVEVIIVDDGSTDNSREIIDSYGDRVVPILKTNGGQASAFNAGFSASHGEIVCFLDSDDVFKPNKVEAIVHDFKENENIGWYFHSLEFFGETHTEKKPKDCLDFSGVYDLRPYITKGKLKGSLSFEIDTATSAICFSRLLLKQILPMPEEIRITSDDYLKYAAFGTSKGFVSSRHLTQQRIHQNNAYTSRTNIEGLRAKTQILTAYKLRKNFPKLSRFSNNLISMGISLYWWIEGSDADLKRLIQDYLNSTTLLEMLEIYIRAMYYRFLHYRLIDLGFRK